jgi:hypothetical protein
MHNIPFFRVLKAIDLGGSKLLPNVNPNRGKKVVEQFTTTPHIMPPELDPFWLLRRQEELLMQIHQENNKIDNPKSIGGLGQKGEEIANIEMRVGVLARTSKYIYLTLVLM